MAAPRTRADLTFITERPHDNRRMIAVTKNHALHVTAASLKGTVNTDK